MDLFVLNENLEAEFIIDTYKSLIWTDRYNTYGDFEIYSSINDELISKVKQDYYLIRSDSEHVMIIEKLLISTDAEAGNMLTISGRSLESILDRRIVWGQKTLSGSLQNGIKELIDENIISPSNTNRKIENFVFEESTDPAITELKIEAQYTGDNLYEIISSICSEQGIGFSVTLNSDKKFVFKLYSGLDRSYDQTNVPYVIFSPDFDNLVAGNYVESKSAMKNVTLVGGEGEGTKRRYTAVGNPSGLNRREMFTDARDISSDCDEDITALFSLKPNILRNIVPNSGFELDTGWTRVTYDSSQAYEGTRSCKLGPNMITSYSVAIKTPIVGHKYYGRRYIKSEGEIGSTDSRFEIYGGDGLGLNWVFAYNRGNYPVWTMHSAIHNITAVNATTYCVRNFALKAQNPCWSDCLLIVDLTEAFGAGKEPAKEWLDENIPWFEDKYAYGCEYPGRAYDISKKSFVNDENFNSARVDISAYVGRTIQITIPKYNNENGVTPNYGIVFQNSAGAVLSSKAWEKYDDSSKSRGSLDSYELLIPAGAKFIVATMYSQSAIDAEVYYGKVDDFECTMIKISNDEYVAQLRQRGKEKLSENTEVISFEGQAETTAMFRYGEDFFIGDIVQISDDYGHETKARILELVTSDDGEGYSVYPTFSTITNDGLPIGYLKLTYIESTGTQYIDTGYRVTNERVRIVYDGMYTDSALRTTLFGSSDNSNTRWIIVPYRRTNDLTFWCGTTGNLFQRLVETNKRYYFDVKVRDGIITVFDGNTIVSSAYNGPVSSNNIFIFCQNASGSPYQLSSSRVYSFKIYDQDNFLVRDFIPCKNKDDIVGLYDVVEGKFYKNSGTGAFRVG